jgi:hypothetical protein
MYWTNKESKEVFRSTLPGTSTVLVLLSAGVLCNDGTVLVVLLLLLLGS